ncbi:hypothetical protein AMTRI_Chr02g215240 [Amborella trichopoda]
MASNKSSLLVMLVVLSFLCDNACLAARYLLHTPPPPTLRTIPSLLKPTLPPLPSTIWTVPMIPAVPQISKTDEASSIAIFPIKNPNNASPFPSLPTTISTIPTTIPFIHITTPTIPTTTPCWTPPLLKP